MSAQDPRMRDQILNFVAVTLVALLIWIWAAGETRETQTAFLELNFTGPTNDSMRISPKELPPIRMYLRGPRRALEDAIDRLRKPITLIAGTLGVPSDAGSHELDLTTIGQNLIDDMGLPVSVTGSDPTDATISIEPLTTVTVAVDPVLPKGVRTSGRIEVKPETATIVVPASLANSDDLRLEAQLSASDLEGRQTGRRHELEIPLSLPASSTASDSIVKINPRTVEVRLTLDANETELALSTPVPVQIAGPPSELESMLVEIDPDDAFLRNVVLRGPAETIGRLEANNAASGGIIAFVHLTSDDLLKRITEKSVTLWNLPSDVTVVSVGDDSTAFPLIGLSIKDRPDPPKN